MAAFRATRDSRAMDESSRPEGLIATLSAHPVITGVIVGCTLLGIALGWVWLPEDWALARKIAGGAVAGAGCGLIVTAPRIVG
jgi:hypothetical protein